MTRTNQRHASKGWVGALASMLVVWTLLVTVGPVQAQTMPAPDDIDSAALEARYATQSLRVSLWLDKSQDEVYRRGEPLSVTFQTNEDAYAVLYHIDVEGRVSVLWPTSRYSDGFAFGGHQYRLPSRQGERLRVGGDEGVGYVQAVVSAYPFDLRDLELDFHHEPTREPFDFYVAGDPYLAMNEVNFVVTGMEDPSEFAVSNHVSYYVHRPVDHPRYLCFQCHDTDVRYDPYDDHCTINVQYDYSWHNDWWDRYGYYPVYYYPVYVYVDPWAGIHWTNYWYSPWYRWPWSPWHSWNYACYSWHYSPYYTHDVYVARKHADRRYRPLDRDRVKQRDRSLVRTKNQLVRGERPDDDRLRAVKERQVIADARKPGTESRERIRGSGGELSPRTERTSREQTRFETQRETRTSPGLRVGADRTTRVGTSDRSSLTRTPRTRANERPDARVTPRSRDDSASKVTPRPDRSRSGDNRRTIRPTSPRRDGDRVWSSRRESSNNDRSSSSSVRQSRPTPRKQENVRPRSDSGSRQESQPRSTVRPNSGSSSRKDSRSSTVRPSRPSPPPTRSTPPPSSPRSGSSGKSKSRSSGGRG